MKEGDKVIFTGELKALDKCTEGIVSKIIGETASVVYLQNIGSNKVYAHSAKITEFKKV